MNSEPEITQTGPLDMQVCVPDHYTDEDIEAFANSARLCGTTNGWKIRKQGHRLLDGADERVSCTGRPGFVHVVLDA
jgi:hypothetical protein